MPNLNPYLRKLNNHSPLLFNGVLWLFAYVILLFIFSKGEHPIRVDYVYTTSFLASVALPTLINLYMLMPRLLKKENYGLYCISFVVNLLVFSQLHTLFFKPMLDWLFPNYFFVSYHSDTKPFVVFSIFLIATSLIKLSEDWFHFNRNENLELKQKNQQMQTQLSALRSQINPHFLFNSLNVIYSLAIEKKESITNAIVQLSDILRYIIYDSDMERVTLKEEIALLENYIAFQKFRVHGFENLTFDVELEDEQFKLYPMLLLPLVENSFKHGMMKDLSATYIQISLFQKATEFRFTIENSLPNNDTEEENPHSGVGLEHIRKNLDIVYPNAHTFETIATEDRFKVSISITNTIIENDH